MKFAAILALLARLRPYRGVIAAAGAVVLVVVLTLLAVHLPDATMRSYPAYGAVLVAFLLGFLSPKPVLPPL